MQWSSITAVSHLVAVGSGAGDVLAQCLNCKPAKTLAYEADDAQAQLLAAEYQQNPAISIKPLAVATAAGSAQLHRFNLPQCNALSAATSELQAIFPGLQALPAKELQTVEMASELVSAKVQGQNNMLLLELPAQNLSLLQHLADKQLLAHFSHLVVQHSEQVLYEDAASLAQLQQFLEEQGYQQLELDNSDVDFPLLRFYRDANAEQLKQTQQQLLHLEQKFTFQESELAEALRQLSEATKLLAAEKQLVKQQEVKLAIAAEQEEKIKADKLKNEQLAVEIESLNTTVESIKLQSLTEINKLKEKNNELATELQSTTKKLTQTENELSSEKSYALARSKEYTSTLEELKESISRLEKELKEQVRINQACNSLLLKMNLYLSKDNEALNK